MVNYMLVFMLGTQVTLNAALMIVYTRTSKVVLEQAERIKELADRKERQASR